MGRFCSPGRFARAVSFSFLAALAAPAYSQAGVLSFRNDTNAAVIVQVMSLVNNVPVRGRPQVLMPGKSYAELAVPGNKQIIIADAKQPTRVLFNSVLPPVMGDEYFSIQVEAAPMPLDKGSRRQPRVKLVPTAKPAPTPSSPAPRRPQSR